MEKGKRKKGNGNRVEGEARWSLVSMRGRVWGRLLGPAFGAKNFGGVGTLVLIIGVVAFPLCAATRTLMSVRHRLASGR